MAPAPGRRARGAHDWVLRAAAPARIARLVVGAASVSDLPGLDHALGWHASRQASERDYGAGRFDPAIVQRIAAWIDRL
jgi:hypothetical protein